jgi:Ca2+-binding EF-hand superfamily protein
MMDSSNNGEVYRFELMDTLKKHNVYVDRVELDLFFKKFDRNQDGKLSFSEFADAIAPHDRHASDSLNRKQANYPREPRFSYSTQNSFEETLKKVFRNFGAQNDMNKRLREKPAFFISAAFDRIDQDNNGHITASELRRFLDDHRHFCSYRDLDLLVARFDKNKDGRITRSEFYDGLLAH